MHLQGTMSPFLSNLSLLTNLSLQSNRFHGEIPSSFGKLPELVYLNISSNNLRGEIPASLQGCQSLKSIDLVYNNLSGVIPEEIGWMKNLTLLALSENNLIGSIPSNLSNLTELTQLELAVNYFTGSIPPQLGALRKLEIFYLHMNFLTGPIPAAISNCTALREISLIENLLSGEIPLELGSKLQNLEKFYAWNNRLSGKIPVTLSNLSQLILLDLSVNNLEGDVPPELGMLKNLEKLYLHSNYLGNSSGNSSLSFLTALTNCSFQKKLHLGSCLFSGNLPASLGALSKDLFFFDLRNNLITGNIPESIGNLSSLVNLNLSYNFLAGPVPASLGRLGQLQRLSLYRNRISGPIPDEMGQMENLGLLDLGANLISGSIPPSLGDEQVIKNLNLSYNRLSGEVPTTGTLTNYNRSSFLGNVGLCGGSVIMGFPPCEVEKQTHNIRKGVLYAVVAIGASCVLFLLAAVFVFCFFRKKDEKPDETMVTSFSGHGPRAYTQRELEIATVGFNEACLLGTGSFGSVYKADIDDGKTTIAVKVLHGDISQSYKLLKRECQILSGIKHRNLGIEVSAKGDIYSFGVMLLEMVTRKRPTSNMFTDGLDLRKWVRCALPDHILDVVDITLKQKANLEGKNETVGSLHRLEQCCIQMLDLAMMCTEDNPQKRPTASSVVQMLMNIWKQLGGRTGKDADASLLYFVGFRGARRAEHLLSCRAQTCFPRQKQVKQFHPYVNRTGEGSEMMIRLVIQAYSPITVDQRSLKDPFENPECEAFDVFVNEILCVGKGHGEDYQVQIAIGQCPRSCIYYVTASQRIILEELLDMYERTGEDADAPLSSTWSAFAVLGIQPSCSAAELEAAFHAKVKQFHLDVNRTGEGSDTMIRRGRITYSVTESVDVNFLFGTLSVDVGHGAYLKLRGSPRGCSDFSI
ncbi:hypothetical protein FEM48_Zijuj02G0144200 [Ziziphus jujuba var. spinosa]|uniref:Protein kinase domain-containing protein n=1 Tax=Ziziphus jujuba var. spinosa TaxID=714518 RepID=A0A978VW74_ZIZJJ|nr:hypothetical protein FEM48_Zijuj02G0144200 [Ziziphus jujuba var. spinosa]